jgi:glyceraldehyde-3-phosphate dehydrogenase (NADP+)
MISFTGGLQTGLRILQEAGLKKIGMELGSNCPTLVMEDADLDRAVPDLVSGMFWAAGQNCLHVQRLLIQDGVYEAVRDRLVAGAEALVVGDKSLEATDMGPLINEGAARKVDKLVAEALAKGATLLTGGTRTGTYFAPTLLEGLPSDCALAREEVYGPVTILYRFRTLEDGIALANDSEYGLQAAIFTQDIATAHKAIAGLACGGVIVNDTTDYRIDAMPFGGVKGSGLGREGLKHAIHDMTEPKVVCFNL